MKTGGVWDFKTYQEKEWFRFLSITFLILVALYFILHIIISKEAGYEYSKLDEKQSQQINRIYFDSVKSNFSASTTSASKEQVTTPKPNENKGSNVNKKNKASTDTSKNSLDTTTLQTKTLDSATIKLNENSNSNNKTKCPCRDTILCERVIGYLTNEFNNKIDTIQIDSLKPYLCSASKLEATSFLSNLRFRVHSYFWLTGPEVYFEIIFWTLFGVLSSLLFNIGVISKDSTTVPTDRSTFFDSSEIPSQVAKLLYAPACTLVIILGYNFFNNQNLVDISSSKGVIAFAFIGGFYSSRMISLLDRLKDVLFPNSGTASLPINKDKVSLKSVIIELQLASIASPIVPVDLTKAIVILKSDLTKEETKALILNEDRRLLFIVDYVIQGSYTIIATVESEKLAGEGKIEMKNTDMFVVIKLDVK